MGLGVFPSSQLPARLVYHACPTSHTHTHAYVVPSGRPPQACKIGKLFAKHFKVAEQEEVLRTQVGSDRRWCEVPVGDEGNCEPAPTAFPVDGAWRSVMRHPPTPAPAGWRPMLAHDCHVG